MQKKTKIKDKSISLFFISDKDNPYLDEDNKIPNILSVVSNENEAEEYIDKRLFIDNCDHFSSWCELRELEINRDSWLKYKSNIYNPYTYELNEVSYKVMASLLRLFYGCAPIGCSYDTLIETSALLVKTKEEVEKEEDLSKYQA